MLTPATAGKTLSEERLRAFVKCSEYYYRGGEHRGSFFLEVAKATYERVVVTSLRKPHSIIDYHKILLKVMALKGQEEDLLEPQINAYLNQCTLYLKDLFEVLPIQNYIPIYGPIAPVVRVSKTPIQLQISGLLRSQTTQTLHAIAFVPASNAYEHCIANDPALHLKLKILKPFVAKHMRSGRPQVKMHVFAHDKRNQMVYECYDSNQTNLTLLKRIEGVIKTIETGHHYPVLPCLYKCPYKSNCYPNE